MTVQHIFVCCSQKSQLFFHVAVGNLFINPEKYDLVTDSFLFQQFHHIAEHAHMTGIRYRHFLQQIFLHFALQKRRRVYFTAFIRCHSSHRSGIQLAFFHHFQKDLCQLRIKLRTGTGTYLLLNLFLRQSSAIHTITRHRIITVRKRHDPRHQRDLFSF